MTKVIAALDNSLAAGPVVGTARALARLLDAQIELLHVTANGQRTANAIAQAVGLPLLTAHGPVVKRLVEAGEEADVAALVVGARSTPAGPRPLGSTALATATSLEKPVVVVPPDARPPAAFRSALVPIQGDLAGPLTPRVIVHLAREAEVDVVVLHVHDEDSLPSFTDQPQHEQRAWAGEFVRRYCPWGIGQVYLETRVGRTEELVPAVAEQTKADLIVLAWTQELAPGRAPVVRAVLTRSHLPVMLLPVNVTAGAR